MAASMNGGHGGHRASLEQFSRLDAERHETIAQLVKELETLQAEKAELVDDLGNERIGRRVLQREKSELETKTNGRSFVVVLIDADADDYIFHERFLNKEDAGGRDAADEIHARVKEYMSQLAIDPENTSIVVRAYANIKGLGDACSRNGKMRAGASIQLFAQGFTRRQALFDVVDVGAGKEEADNKIRENISFYLSSHQCKHILLGICHDSGYASHLGRFASDAATSERITLLQGSSAIHPRLSALGFPRPPQEFHTVFAPKVGSVAIDWAPLAHVASPSSGVSHLLPPRPLPSSSSSSSTSKGHSNPQALTGRLEIRRDVKGKRVDPLWVIQHNSPVLKALLGQKLCAYFYLRGWCEGCKYKHVRGPLSPAEYECFLWLTRQGRCKGFVRSGDCQDPLCIYGHF